ncbi:MAG: hypothetical protein QM817_10310 [Archangium sp.]
MKAPALDNAASGDSTKLQAENDKLRAELDALRAASTKEATELRERISDAHEANDRLEESLAVANRDRADALAKANRAGAMLLEAEEKMGAAHATAETAAAMEAKGYRKFRVGSSGGFYNGVRLSEGDTVTLKPGDEPSRTWTLITPSNAVQVNDGVPAANPGAVRASDRGI